MNYSRNDIAHGIKSRSLFVRSSSLVLGLTLTLLLSVMPVRAADTTGRTGQTFATPEDAAMALKKAAISRNVAELHRIFGPDLAEIQNPDRVQATNDLEDFADSFKEANHLERRSDTKRVLVVGTNEWPFPVPIVQENGRWHFDTDAGKEEILNRRIGKNELSVLETMRAYVDAQREYASQYRNGSDVMQYAQKLASTPGKKDGLYWPADQNGEISPLGPFVADAQSEGYQVKMQGQQTTRAPFEGYYFKILTSQGKDAPGGKYNYIINGHMIAGFGLVAWPADYGNTGIMTFIVNQQGRVYQKDLGPRTSQLAPALNGYDPGPGWTLSQD